MAESGVCGCDTADPGLTGVAVAVAAGVAGVAAAAAVFVPCNAIGVLTTTEPGRTPVGVAGGVAGTDQTVLLGLEVAMNAAGSGTEGAMLNRSGSGGAPRNNSSSATCDVGL